MTVKLRITQTMPHNSPGSGGTLLLPKILTKFECGHPQQGIKCRCKSATGTFDK